MIWLLLVLVAVVVIVSAIGVDAVLYHLDKLFSSLWGNDD